MSAAVSRMTSLTLRSKAARQDVLMKFGQFAHAVATENHHQIVFAEARHPMHVAEVIVADAIVEIDVSLPPP